MNDHDAVLRSVLSDPDDLDPRLIYADCLEEQGEEDRARFLRLHVEMARTSKRDDKYPGLEKALTRLWERKWKEITGFGLLPGMSINLTVGITCTARIRWPMPNYTEPEFLVRVYGGMVQSVRTNMEMFLAGAKGLFSRHPITSVEINNKDTVEDINEEDEPTGVVWVFWTGDESTNQRSYIWPAVMAPENLETDGTFYYPSEVEATEDLHRRCLAWGRKEAGLPPWTPPKGEVQTTSS